MWKRKGEERRSASSSTQPDDTAREEQSAVRTQRVSDSRSNMGRLHIRHLAGVLGSDEDDKPNTPQRRACNGLKLDLGVHLEQPAKLGRPFLLAHYVALLESMQNKCS